ncbi:hypothetical protein Tco_0395872, partial [Tanacetum coccineum]
MPRKWLTVGITSSGFVPALPSSHVPGSDPAWPSSRIPGSDPAWPSSRVPGFDPAWPSSRVPGSDPAWRLHLVYHGLIQPGLRLDSHFYPWKAFLYQTPYHCQIIRARHITKRILHDRLLQLEVES